ncbi:MAG TPA: OmpA family protein [Candidatus Avimuribaculum pullicola]|nr:OmpA family protein [Candidatus Avimuribaculum pullicola]
MKKVFLLALLCTLFMSANVEAQEVTYVEDPSQGYVMNRFKDNWFISGEIGVGGLGSSYDSELKFGKRLMPSFNIGVGKWFSPILGVRFSADFRKQKGATIDGMGVDPLNPETTGDNYLINRFWSIGPAADVYLNLTNWWCGYKPGRVYNAVLYGGVAVHTQMIKKEDGNDTKWRYNTVSIGVRGGLLNTFSVSDHVDLLLDLRLDMDQANYMDYTRQLNLYGQVLVGVAYKFNKTTWGAPIVPVCPEYKYTDAEGDALVERLKAADAKIADLERQLNECINRPVPEPEPVKEAPLATIYFPIGSSRVQGVQSKVVAAVANAMGGTEDNYVVTGWADNYTGSAARNEQLRQQRADNVVKMLVKNGVASDRLETATGSSNLTNYGEKSADLDRAATIEIKK